MTPVDAAFLDEHQEAKWIQDEAVDPAGIIRPQKYLPAFWIRSKAAKAESIEGGTEVVMYLVGGGYITGESILF